MMVNYDIYVIHLRDIKVIFCCHYLVDYLFNLFILFYFISMFAFECTLLEYILKADWLTVTKHMYTVVDVHACIHTYIHHTNYK